MLAALPLVARRLRGVVPVGYYGDPEKSAATFLKIDGMFVKDILDDPVDLAMVMGTGFPPFRGGLLRWADAEDIRKIHDALSEYTGTLGNRFAPAPLLVRMAQQNRTFTDLN